MIPLIVYLASNIFFTYLDLTGKPAALLKYKIQEEKGVPVSLAIALHKTHYTAKTKGLVKPILGYLSCTDIAIRMQFVTIQDYGMYIVF